MRAWPFPAQPPGTALIRQFALLSLLLTALMTTALSLVLSFYVRKDLLDREWGFTADYIRTEALRRLTPADFAALSPAAHQRFRDFYEQSVMMPQIIRVKIYARDMAVVWSDEPRLHGQRFVDNAHLRGAIAGRVMVNIRTGAGKTEHIYEADRFGRFVEVYVPIVFPGSAEVAGVVEAYKAIDQVYANIRQGQLTVFATALAGGALLYGSLFWIVRRAARRIEEQHHALENRSRELAAANEELLAVQTRLLESERMAAIGAVVTAVAHGIRNPLANIRAVAQVAVLDGGRYGAGNAATIMGEVDRLEGRLKALLQFVRPAQRRSAPVDLNTVIEESLRMVDGRLAAGQIRVERRLAPALPPVLGDAMLLEQVFLSLIGNALEALPGDRGTITLRTGTTADETTRALVVAEVQDTGVGIAPEAIPKVFEPFYTTKAQGTGLGLAMARKFVEAHGGTMSVSSRPGQGATFQVTLPAQPAR